MSELGSVDVGQCRSSPKFPGSTHQDAWRPTFRQLPGGSTYTPCGLSTAACSTSLQIIRGMPPDAALVERAVRGMLSVPPPGTLAPSGSLGVRRVLVQSLTHVSHRLCLRNALQRASGAGPSSSRARALVTPGCAIPSSGALRRHPPARRRPVTLRRMAHRYWPSGGWRVEIRNGTPTKGLGSLSHAPSSMACNRPAHEQRALAPPLCVAGARLARRCCRYWATILSSTHVARHARLSTARRILQLWPSEAETCSGAARWRAK